MSTSIKVSTTHKDQKTTKGKSENPSNPLPTSLNNSLSMFKKTAARPPTSEEHPIPVYLGEDLIKLHAQLVLPINLNTQQKETKSFKSKPKPSGTYHGNSILKMSSEVNNELDMLEVDDADFMNSKWLEGLHNRSNIEAKNNRRTRNKNSIELKQPQMSNESEYVKNDRKERTAIKASSSSSPHAVIKSMQVGIQLDQLDNEQSNRLLASTKKLSSSSSSTSTSSTSSSSTSSPTSSSSVSMNKSFGPTSSSTSSTSSSEHQSKRLKTSHSNQTGQNQTGTTMNNTAILRRRSNQTGLICNKLPRTCIVHVLKYFTIMEVARLQRFICREFRDAGQDRILERGSRTLMEQGIGYFYGHDFHSINKRRGVAMMRASCETGCKTAEAYRSLFLKQSSQEEQKKCFLILKNLADREPPYHYAQCFVGMCYEHGKGVAKNETKVVEWYNKASRNGSAISSIRLGTYYEEGKCGLTQSNNIASNFYEASANTGHCLARLRSAELLMSCPSLLDFNKALELFTSSANQNFVDAQYQLGLLHMDGSKDNEILPINEQGVIVTTPMTIPINKELGFQWLSTAAKQGHAVAQYEVGMSYRMGEGTDKNLKLAFEWWMKAAQQGDMEAEYQIGDGYHFGDTNISVDLDLALTWYQKAAAQGHDRATYRVQNWETYVMYDEGHVEEEAEEEEDASDDVL